MKLLACASVAAHVVVGGLVVVAGLWEIEELGRPHRGVAMATLSAPAAPSGSPESAAPERVRPKKRMVEDHRQPGQTVETRELTGDTGGGSGQGSDGGDGTGKGDGEGSGGSGALPGLCIVDCADSATLTVPEREIEEPRHVPQAILGKLRRTAGRAQIQPPTKTRTAMQRKNQHTITAVVEMCLDKRGGVSRQSMHRGSGYPEYDARLLSAVRAWRYEPYTANGRAVAICTHVTFVYQQE